MMKVETLENQRVEHWVDCSADLQVGCLAHWTVALRVAQWVDSKAARKEGHSVGPTVVPMAAESAVRKGTLLACQKAEHSVEKKVDLRVGHSAFQKAASSAASRADLMVLR